MGQIFGFAILSLFITGILLLPFIDFLYKMKMQRQNQKTLDPLNKRAFIFDRLHKNKIGTPIGGGVLIILVVTIITLWAIALVGIEVKFWEVFVLLFAFISFGLLGFLDDLKKIFNGKNPGFFGLRFRAKFIIQWILALIIGAVFYYQLGYDFLFVHWIDKLFLGPFYIFFAAFVIVSFVNAFNITDGLDGLSPGLFLICMLAFLAITNNSLADTFLGTFIAILIGSVAAFLYFNIYKARLWLGDVGSLSLGAILAVIGLLTGKVVPLAFIGGIFVLEVGSSLIQLISKKYFGRKIFPIAPLHLLFLNRGWEEPKIVMRAWLVGFVLAIIGLYIALA